LVPTWVTLNNLERRSLYFALFHRIRQLCTHGFNFWFLHEEIALCLWTEMSWILQPAKRRGDNVGGSMHACVSVRMFVCMYVIR